MISFRNCKSRIVEGFVTDYKMCEPINTWVNRTITRVLDKQGRFDYIKRTITEPLHPPIKFSSGKMHLYKTTSKIYEYELTADDLVRMDRNNSRTILVTNDQRDMLVNRRVKLRCDVEVVNGAEYLKVVKILKRSKPIDIQDKITLALEIQMKPKVGSSDLFERFMKSLLEKIGKGSDLGFFELDNIYYIEIQDGYFIHYKVPYSLGIFTRTHTENIEDYNTRCYKMGRIHDILRKNIDNSVDFKYKFVSDKSILLAGL